MMHKHFMVLKKLGREQDIFFKRCNQIFFKVANLYAIYFYISIFIPHKKQQQKKTNQDSINFDSLKSLSEFTRIFPNLLT